jgi:hypothetical protein
LFEMTAIFGHHLEFLETLNSWSGSSSGLRKGTLWSTKLKKTKQNKIKKKQTKNFTQDPVRILARIDPPHPLVCRKRRLNGVVFRMRPDKPRPRVTVGVAR